MKIKKCAKCGKRPDVILGDISLCYKHYYEFITWKQINTGSNV